MNAQLILNFDNQDDLRRVLQFLKEIGLSKINVTSNSKNISNGDFAEPITENLEIEAYEEAQMLKGDAPKPLFAIGKYSVYEQ